jgi:hypothetical protein
MNEIIRLELLHQDILLVKDPVSYEDIIKEISFFLDIEEAESAAYQAMKARVTFRCWHTEIGIKNMLVVDTYESIGVVSRVVLSAADTILSNKEVYSKEMEGLLLQLIMDNIYPKN